MNNPRISLRRELIAEGWTDRAIARMVRSGAWHRLRHGAYVDGPAWRALDPPARHVLEVLAVVQQSATDVVVSHTSALPFGDAPTWGLDLGEVHITRTDGRAGRREAGVRQHRGLVLNGDVREVDGIAVMAPARVALEVTTVAGPEPALVVLNHLLHTGATTMDAVRERYGQGIDRWSGTLATDLVLCRAEGRCESVGESRLWHFFHTERMPLPIPQYIVRRGDGSIAARLDFAWPELGVFVEFDGLLKYGGPNGLAADASRTVVREKAREDEVRELTGWLCVRVTWADLADPARLAARLRAAFERARRTAVA